MQILEIKCRKASMYKSMYLCAYVLKLFREAETQFFFFNSPDNFSIANK